MRKESSKNYEKTLVYKTHELEKGDLSDKGISITSMPEIVLDQKTEDVNFNELLFLPHDMATQISKPLWLLLLNVRGRVQ